MQFHLTRVFGFAAAELQLIHNAGRGGDEVEVEFAGQAFLNDLQMEQPKKATAKAKGQRLWEACATEESWEGLALGNIRIGWT